jgi:hypothetical protein
MKPTDDNYYDDFVARQRAFADATFGPLVPTDTAPRKPFAGWFVSQIEGDCRGGRTDNDMRGD